MSDIAGIVYAPQKAIKRVAENPKYIGVVIIAILFVVANVGLSYALASKQYLEITVPTTLPTAPPKADEFTENSTLWTSSAGANVTDSGDHVNGTVLVYQYYGNVSIQFTILDSTEIWAQLEKIGPVNCSGPDSFNKLSFRLKLVEPITPPHTATISLFSTVPSDYFSYDITGNLSKEANIWDNLTIFLNTEGWSRTGATADWSNITGLKLDFTWLEYSNITVRVDGLFFHGPFESLIDIFGNVPLNAAISAFMQYTITWVILAGLLYIFAKGFGGKPIWKPLLIVVGFILVPTILRIAVIGVGFAATPDRYYPFELLGGVNAEGTAANNTITQQAFLASQLDFYLLFVFFIWSAALCALTVHMLYIFSWAKSIPIGAIAYFIAIYVVGLLGF